MPDNETLESIITWLTEQEAAATNDSRSLVRNSHAEIFARGAPLHIKRLDIKSKRL